MSMAYAKRQRQAWTMERLQYQAPDWSPLDGVPAPEYVPDFWIGPHVGLRLVEAFRTLANLPMRGYGSVGSCWPEYYPTWEDMLAREQSDKELKEQQMRAQNRVRILPTAQDISRMEIAITWSGHYLQRADAILVQRVALMRAHDRELDQIAYRLRRDPRELRRRNRQGLDQIADGLSLDAVAVF